MSKFKNYLLLVVITFLVYGASLFYGFSQDDWFHLSISRADSIVEFLNFFNPFHVSWIFFRPLSTQLPYWLSTKLFSLASAPYFMHFIMLILHATNAYLVQVISAKYLRPKYSVMLSIFYAISNIHFLSLFYIGAIQQILSTTFSLLAIYVYLYDSKSRGFKLAVLTLAALLSKELALRLPIILFTLAYLKEGSFKAALSSTASSIIVAASYVMLRFGMGSGVASEYTVSFSVGTTIATLMWYFMFVVGYPEEILHYGLSLGRVDLARFLGDHTVLAALIVLASLIFLGFIISTIFHSRSKNLVFLALAVICLLPIIFLPTHRYPHYLDISILFLGIYLLAPLKEVPKYFWLLIPTLTLGIISSIYLETITHWTTKRAMIARAKEQEIIKAGLCQNPAGITFTGSRLDLQELSYAMSIANGPRVICQNPSLPVYYKESL